MTWSNTTSSQEVCKSYCFIFLSYQCYHFCFQYVSPLAIGYIILFLLTWLKYLLDSMYVKHVLPLLLHLTTDCKYKVIVIYFHATHICLTESMHHNHSHCLFSLSNNVWWFFFLCFHPSFFSFHLSSWLVMNRIPSIGLCHFLFVFVFIHWPILSFKSFQFLAFLTKSTWKKLHTVKLACV